MSLMMQALPLLLRNPPSRLRRSERARLSGSMARVAGFAQLLHGLALFLAALALGQIQGVAVHEVDLLATVERLAGLARGLAELGAPIVGGHVGQKIHGGFADLLDQHLQGRRGQVFGR
jgi:F0F1-type ATP synthase membrane subunit c/vacuolar-type H+-ATPase subunit K